MEEENEAPRDPRLVTPHYGYTYYDCEGHHACTVYIGLHLPGFRRKGHHRRHHRHHHHHHHHKNRDYASSEYGRDFIKPVTPPSERVHFILGGDDDVSHEPHPIFSEMGELHKNGDGSEWRETARWVKFEEDVEEGGDRWSKPHVATVSLHSIFELRSCVLNGTVLLDMDAHGLEQIAELTVENMTTRYQLSPELQTKLKEALLLRHRHQCEKRHEWSDKGSRLPLIRSLAEIGRNSSKLGSYILGNVGNGNNSEEVRRNSSSASLPGIFGQSQGKCNNSGGDTPSSTNDPFRFNQAFMKKIPPKCEAFNILAGEVDFLEKAVSAFVRLSEAQNLGDLTEVPLPSKFLFVMLGPPCHMGRYHEIGRAAATLMSDEVFHEVAYKAKSRLDILAGLDEFLDAVTILPPGVWDPSIRIEPPGQTVSQEGRKKQDVRDSKQTPNESSPDESEMNGLMCSGRLFGGLKNDVQRKAPFFCSDFKDALATQCIASIIYLYFACLTPIITFGGLLGDVTHKRMAAMESLLSGAICGLLFGLFSGQPLTILGSTGPVLVFEGIVFDFAQRFGIDYLSWRLWIGLWSSLFLLILVTFDASVYVRYVTRFTEEIFATLISTIFIYKAFENVVQIGHKFPLRLDPVISDYVCQCHQVLYSDGKLFQNITSITSDECQRLNGTYLPQDCAYSEVPYVPDVFLLSIILFMSTFAITVLFREFKNTPFFSTRVRSFFSDFAVVIAIGSMTAVDAWLGVATLKLDVPQEFKPTWSGRGWIVPFIGDNPWWTAPAAAVPALLVTILLFMDQQITSVIVNRKENKLKKGCGYHLDLFILSILVTLCSVFGLPWFVAATVLSITHVNSLKIESECSAPGEKPQFLGVREQRVTHIAVFILIGLSVFFTSFLKYIPMPVLYGVFLYMGVTSLKGSQLFDRILIVFMPQKYQPDYKFLRHVPIMRVHLFTGIQFICCIVMWVIKQFKYVSFTFPLVLVGMIIVRRNLGCIFEKAHLEMLDDSMPDSINNKSEKEHLIKDEMNEAHEEAQHSPTSVDITMCNGNILKVPVDSAGNDRSHSINISEVLMESGLWKSIEQEQKMPSQASQEKFYLSSPKKKKKRSIKKDSLSTEEERRLSTMEEVEEELSSMRDNGDSLLSHASSATCDVEGRNSNRTPGKDVNANETPV